MTKFVRKVFLVDALGTGPFTGSPTFVVFLQAPLDKFKMATISHELGTSQTVFVLAHNRAYLLRFFNQFQEVPLGGHACHAVAHLIYELGLLPPGKTLTCLTQEGELTARLTPTGHIAVSFPSQNLSKMEPANLELYGSMLALTPKDITWGAITSTRQAILAVGPSVNLKTLEPDRIKLAKSGASTLAVTFATPADREYGLRCFSPNIYHPEQQVSVNVNRALAPHWARLLGTKLLRVRQFSSRGGLSEIDVTSPSRVIISGQSQTVLRADLAEVLTEDLM
ncbi:MAG: PhzF family phenazine biosynthesis protein [Deltaproteobacteria bacterium]|nr:PhzF family phenazine biosynthesis protein [Deltaproteobacteria bacterium]